MFSLQILTFHHYLNCPCSIICHFALFIMYVHNQLSYSLLKFMTYSIGYHKGFTYVNHVTRLCSASLSFFYYSPCNVAFSVMSQPLILLFTVYAV